MEIRDLAFVACVSVSRAIGLLNGATCALCLWIGNSPAASRGWSAPPELTRVDFDELEEEVDELVRPILGDGVIRGDLAVAPAT